MSKAVWLASMTLAAFAFIAQAAQAAPFEVGATDDFTLLQNDPPGRDAAAGQMKAAGVTTTRFIVWPWTDLGRLDAAVTASHVAGLNVYMTLGDNSVDWMAKIAGRYGDSVDSFGIVDEPDLTLSGRFVNQCTSAGDIESTLASAGVKTSRRRVRVRLIYKGKVQRVYVRGKVAFRGFIKGKRVGLIRKRQVRGRGGARYYIIRYYRVARRWRRVVTTSATSNRTHSTAMLADQVCVMILAGRRYKEIVMQAAAAIREHAPNARILAGETSPIAPVEYFIREAARGGLPVDGWAHHAYQWNDPYQSHATSGGTGIGDIPKVHDLARLPIYITEFGYMRTGYGGLKFTNEQMAWLIPRAFAVAARDGARMLAWQGWTAPPTGWTGLWDTGLGVGDSDLPLDAFTAAAT